MEAISKPAFNKLKTAPQGPGVYYLKNKQGKIIYIGKAVNLAKRIAVYFQKNTANQRGIRALIKNELHSFNYTETGTEVEALIKEAHAVKTYQPKYNTLLKDDKNFIHVVITKETWPRVILTHQPQVWNHKAAIYGPFVKGREIKRLMRSLRKILPYRTCKNIASKPCLDSKIGLCPIHEPERARLYPYHLELLHDFLKGKARRTITKKLENRMRLASARQAFEEAAAWKSLLRVYKTILQPRHLINDVPRLSNQTSVRQALVTIQKIIGMQELPYRIEIFDISNLCHDAATGSMVVFINGLPAKSHYRRFLIRLKRGGDSNKINEVISRRFQHPEWDTPNLLLIDGGRAQLNAALKALKHKNINLPAVISLAKSGNILYTITNSIPLSSMPDEARFLLERLIQEAHRFAISYHRKRRALDFTKKTKKT